MILFADVNTIWRARIAEAMSDLGAEVLGIRPGSRPTRSHSEGPRLTCLDVPLPWGWASRLAWPAQAYLAQRLRGHAGSGTALVVTIPQYLPLVRLLHRQMPAFYYCSDDYRSYVGWGSDRMRRLEGEMLKLCEGAFFVSKALADRAIADYDIDPVGVHVSMNGTEPRFLATDENDVPDVVRALPRPIVGVVGAINERIDLDLLLRVAALQGVGTLLIVGPVDRHTAETPTFRALKAQQRVVLAGAQPHGDLHRWTQAIDVALIPYRPSELNFYASPMRLFDHLASGRPIIATAACDQCSAFGDDVAVGTSVEEVLDRLTDALEKSFIPLSPGRIESARDHLWNVRARHMIETLRRAL